MSAPTDGGSDCMGDVNGNQTPATSNTSPNSSIPTASSIRKSEAEAALRRIHLSDQLIKAAQNDDLNEAQKLLAEGVNVAYRDPYSGYTALHIAVRKGSTSMTVLLFEAGAPLEVGCDIGRTPLYWAACYGKTQCIQILLACGANVNAQDKNGRTPLHAAAACSYEACVRVLLDAGADKSIQDNYRETSKASAPHDMRDMF